MIKKIPELAAILTLTVASGCASLPNANIGYSLTTSDVSVKVVRTVACNKAGIPIVANTVAPVVQHKASTLPEDYISIPLSKLKGPFTDSDVKFEFYDDGRLKSINETATGKGEDILKTSISIGAAAIAFAEVPGEGVSPFKDECEIIKLYGGDKPLTFIYNTELDIEKVDVEQEIKIASDNLFFASQLPNVLGKVWATVTSSNPPQSVPVDYDKTEGDNVLTARHPGKIIVEVRVDSVINYEDGPIWKGEIPISQIGVDYPIPLPSPALFGKKSLNATFAESGSLSSIQFTSETGTGQALNVINSALDAIPNETTAEKAAEVKADADLIAQQQRLIKCMADPQKCE